MKVVPLHSYCRLSQPFTSRTMFWRLETYLLATMGLSSLALLYIHRDINVFDAKSQKMLMHNNGLMKLSKELTFIVF